MNIATRTGVVASAAAVSLLLAACSPSNEQTNSNPAPKPTNTASEAPAPIELSGELNGAGASSQESAMEAWRASFQNLNNAVTINYDPVGSGGGRTQFLEGAVPFFGTDSLLKAEEYEAAKLVCGPEGAIHLPVYISPVAVIFNLDGLEHINLDSAVLAQIFDGKIAKWNDPAITALNAGVELPDLAITIVRRADDSGTTENFTDYLENTTDQWPYEASKEWPNALGESGPTTTAVVQIVTDTRGAIGYADASRAGTLGTVAIKVGEEFVPFSAEAAAAAVVASPLAEGANGDNDLAYKLDRNLDAAGVYPLVLVSYLGICQDYDDANTKSLVTSFVKFVASQEGQQIAGQAAGSAPLSAELSSRIEAIVDEIAAK